MDRWVTAFAPQGVQRRNHVLNMIHEHVVVQQYLQKSLFILESAMNRKIPVVSMTDWVPSYSQHLLIIHWQIKLSPYRFRMMFALSVFLQCLFLKVSTAGIIQRTLNKDEFASKTTNLCTIPSQISSSSIFFSAEPTDSSIAYFQSTKNGGLKHIARNYDDAPSPTQLGLTSTCNTYYLVKQGDYCYDVIFKLGNLTFNEFYSWNP